MNKPKDGAPGTTDHSPTLEGPQENRPSGILASEGRFRPGEGRRR